MKSGVCAFCGVKGDLSGEDAIPRWASRLVASLSGSKGVILSTRVVDPDTGDVLVQTQRKFGALSAYKLPVVCETCNNNWMSQIETDAQRVLTPLIQDKRSGLTKGDQLIVARWLALKTFTFDLLGHRHTSSLVVFDAADRRAFYDDPNPPPELWARLGRLKNYGTEVCFHSIEPLTTAESRPGVPSGTPHQVLFFLSLGPVLFQTALINRRTIDLPLTIPRIDPVANWTFIWPTLGEVDWPPPRSMEPQNLDPFQGDWPNPELYGVKATKPSGPM